MKNNQFDQDLDGEVINSERTYEAIAETLEKKSSIVFGWTDQEGSHLDIMMVLSPIQIGNLQGGVSAFTHLFVGVLRVGAFGFRCSDRDLHHDYIAEKLGMREGPTLREFSRMLNKVRALLADD